MYRLGKVAHCKRGWDKRAKIRVIANAALIRASQRLSDERYCLCFKCEAGKCTQQQLDIMPMSGYARRE